MVAEFNGIAMDGRPASQSDVNHSALSASLHGPILHLLRLHPAGLSVHELVTTLKLDADTSLEWDSGSNLSIFRVNFVVMNALFLLQTSLADEDYGLEISTLKVRMFPCSEQASTQALDQAANASLRAYYLDWNNLEETTAEEVESMLDGFWRRYWSFDKMAEALSVLGLESGAGEAQIRKSFRRLASVHHPDKGGEASRFLEIREAYESLMVRFNQPAE